MFLCWLVAFIKAFHALQVLQKYLRTLECPLVLVSLSLLTSPFRERFWYVLFAIRLHLVQHMLRHLRFPLVTPQSILS